MNSITLTTAELKELLTQAAAEGALLALKTVKQADQNQWLTAAEAMALIKCGTSKLHYLTVEQRVETNGLPRKEKRFSKTSINNYISNGRK